MGSYDADFYAWANEQAALLRSGRLHEVDVANLAEEIESLGRSEKRELVNRLSVLLAHLLKWQVQPSFRGSSWRLTIEEQRARLQQHLADNPSLRAKLPEAVIQAYRLGWLAAQRETGLGQDVFPREPPWSIEQVLDEQFYPQ